MNACGGMGGKGQTSTKWNDNKKKSLRSNRTYVNMSKRCISPSLWQIGRRQVPYKVRLMHNEPRKQYWLTKRNKSRCSPQWSIWTTLWKKKSIVYHLKYATSCVATYHIWSWLSSIYQMKDKQFFLHQLWQTLCHRCKKPWRCPFSTQSVLYRC